MIPLINVYRSNNEAKYVEDATLNGWGNDRDKYTNMFAAKLGTIFKNKNLILTSSFHGALHILVKALSLRPNDEIIAPNISWVGTVNPFVWIGLNVKFADVSPITCCMDYESAISLITEKTRAIILVHAFGNVADAKLFRSLCDEKGIWLIEDCAPAFGSYCENQQVGTIGHFGVYSFNATKILTTGGEGGALLDNTGDFIEAIRSISNQGRSTKDRFRYKIDRIGLKYNITNIQCAFGCAALENFHLITKKKKEVYQYYKKLFAKYPFFTMLNDSIPKNTHNLWLPILKCKEKGHVNKLLNLLDSKGIETRPIFPTLSSLGIYNMSNITHTPKADELVQSAICLPSHTEITEAELDYIVSIIGNYKQT